MVSNISDQVAVVSSLLRSASKIRALSSLGGRLPIHWYFVALSLTSHLLHF